MFGSIPFFGISVWRNPHVRELLFSGWTPIIVAMLISSGAGLVLERYVEQFKGLAMLTPILCGTVIFFNNVTIVLNLTHIQGLAGNLGSIYASRISTCLHKGVQEQFKKVENALLLMNVPVQLLFLVIVWFLEIGHLDFTLAFAISYFLVSMICVSFNVIKKKI